MKAWIFKQDFKWFKEMQNEARTRHITFSTYRTRLDDSEIEVTIYTKEQSDKINWYINVMEDMIKQEMKEGKLPTLALKDIDYLRNKLA